MIHRSPRSTCVYIRTYTHNYHVLLLGTYIIVCQFVAFIEVSVQLS